MTHLLALVFQELDNDAPARVDILQELDNDAPARGRSSGTRSLLRAFVCDSRHRCGPTSHCRDPAITQRLIVEIMQSHNISLSRSCNHTTFHCRDHAITQRVHIIIASRRAPAITKVSTSLCLKKMLLRKLYKYIACLMTICLHVQLVLDMANRINFIRPYSLTGLTVFV